MNHLLSPGKLLDENGDLREAGYAFSLVKEYHRNDIKASKLRIKEWDYYYVGNHDFAIGLTIDDNSYMDLCSVSIFDYKNKTYLENSTMHFFSLGKRNFPSTSVIGNLSYHDKKAIMNFDNDGKVRHLYGTFFDFEKGNDLTFDIYLEQTRKDTMVIATPFRKKAHFYYNQKINNLSAKGKFVYKEKIYDLDGSSGVLDWGRGVWTLKNTWYWGSMSDIVDGHRIGFNLGYGFGDTSRASENMFFYDDKAYKLDDVIFNIPKHKNGKENYGETWTITSAKGDIQLIFHPLIVRKGGGNYIVLKSIQRQVFGVFEGTITVDGKVFEIKDCYGFAEKVFNCW